MSTTRTTLAKALAKALAAHAAAHAELTNAIAAISAPRYALDVAYDDLDIKLTNRKGGSDAEIEAAYAVHDKAYAKLNEALQARVDAHAVLYDVHEALADAYAAYAAHRPMPPPG